MRRLFMFLGGVFSCFFCNPENKPSGCSAKINRAQIYHFIVCDAILQARQTQRQILRKNTIISSSTEQQLTSCSKWPCWLSTLQENTSSFSEFSCSTWTQNIRRKSRTCCMCIFGCRVEVVYYWIIRRIAKRLRCMATWVLRNKEFFLIIVLYTQALIIVL